MRTCLSCGEENPDRAKFCLSCGAALEAAPAAAREVRKTVTVVFSDVTGSTALGERLDPEALRRLMARYFAEMKAVLERHGGTVEKFIGDAVMAVFGIPVLHEDDALRACRAAVEMREALATLNKETERDLGLTIAARTGVNTGEVVAGDPAAGQTLVTGDAVNTAARLEQAAAPGEILIGETTHRLVRDAVVAQDAGTVAAKGKAEPVRAYRLLDAHPTALGHARRLDSPMVGRDGELGLLLQAFDRAVSERSCHLFTVLGSAGVGKSRLVAEFLERVGDRAAVLRGRCLPYGEGITFWPVAEAIKQAAGVQDDDPPEQARGRIAALVASEEHGPVIANHVAQVLGLVANSAVPEETFWAIRALFEAVARERPLVLVLDDIHWGEPAFLDLVEHIADWSRDVPILLLCPARPELLDARPAWGGGKMNASTILLEPLPAEEASKLVHNLVGAVELPEDVVARITEAAEGNPLFVEEMLGMLIDEGRLVRVDGAWAPAGDLAAISVPPTIHALLAARLDRLEPPERRAIERAAVVGKDFWLGAVVDLSPEALRPGVQASLMALVRKELVRPAHSTVAGDPAYRFRHLLIRDAAYDSISKETRAELHERFADWLEGATGDRVAEYEEIIGYHLEQAYGYRAALGAVDEVGRHLASRAAGHLVAAGMRARARGDEPGTVSLLGRAGALLPADDPTRIGLVPELGLALWKSGDLPHAEEVLTEALATAEAAGDPPAAARIRVELRWVEMGTAPDRHTMDEVIEEIERDVATLEASGDDRGLSRAWALRGFVANMVTDFSGMARYSLRSIEHGRRAGTVDPDTVAGLAFGLLIGPLPVQHALARFGDVVASLPPGPARERTELTGRAELLTLVGDEEQARAAARRARGIALELGGGVQAAIASWAAARVEHGLGRFDAAEPLYRETYDRLARMGERGWRSTLCCEFGLALWELGRDAEVLQLAAEGRELGSADDIATQVLSRDIAARALARRGDHEEAGRLIREALDMARRMDSPTWTAEALRGMSVVLAAAGRTAEAAEHVRAAIALLDAKGAARPASVLRRELSALEAAG